MRKYLSKIAIILIFLLSISYTTIAAELILNRENSIDSSRPTPDRVACLYAFTGHTVVMLGKGESIIAVVKGLKRDKLLARVFPGLKKIATPANGGEINIEALLNTHPDIIFLKPETANIQGEIDKLDRFNLPYFVAGYRSMEEQMQVIEDIGSILGVLDRAQIYTNYYRDVIKRVQTIANTIPTEKRIKLYHSINEANRTTGPNTLEAEWSAVTGVVNVSVDANLKQKGDKSYANIEQILLWNPEIIIANESSSKEEILQDKKWAHIKAVQNKKVYSIPIGISRWGHPGGLETPLAILWTAKLVYPEYFKDIDLKKEILFFYQEFFNLQLTDKDIEQILSGKGMRRKRQKQN